MDGDDANARHNALRAYLARFTAQVMAQAERGEVNPVEVDQLVDAELARVRPAIMDGETPEREKPPTR